MVAPRGSPASKALHYTQFPEFGLSHDCEWRWTVSFLQIADGTPRSLAYLRFMIASNDTYTLEVFSSFFGWWDMVMRPKMSSAQTNSDSAVNSSHTIMVIRLHSVALYGLCHATHLVLEIHLSHWRSLSLRTCHAHLAPYLTCTDNCILLHVAGRYQLVVFLGTHRSYFHPDSHTL